MHLAMDDWEKMKIRLFEVWIIEDMRKSVKIYKLRENFGFWAGINKTVCRGKLKFSIISKKKP